jgi:hypothetical protein
VKKIIFGLCGAALVMTSLYLVLIAFLKPESLTMQLPHSWLIWSVALMLIVLIGLPLHYLLTHFAHREWWAYVVTSVFAGLCFLWLLSGMRNPIAGWAFWLGFGFPIALICGIGGFTFWGIAVRRNFVKLV